MQLIVRYMDISLVRLSPSEDRLCHKIRFQRVAKAEQSNELLEDEEGMATGSAGWRDTMVLHSCEICWFSEIRTSATINV